MQTSLQILQGPFLSKMKKGVFSSVRLRWNPPGNLVILILMAVRENECRISQQL